MKKIVYTILALVILTASTQAQIKTPAPSPTSTVKQAVGLGDITLVYSRPSVKGRTIFGDLVPFDKIWRTGANSSTKISFSEEVKIGGTKVPAGEYALYTIPGKTEWTFIIHKNTTYWGSDDENYKQSEDMVRLTAKPVSLSSNVESFTISFDDLTSNSAMLNLSWEKTKVGFKIETDIDTKVLASIESTLNPKPSASSYYSAASYYYDNNKDMAKALEYVNKATEMNKEGFWIMHLKAKIQTRMKDYKGAAISANASIAEATKQKNADYVALNEKLLAENAKMK